MRIEGVGIVLIWIRMSLLRRRGLFPTMFKKIRSTTSNIGHLSKRQDNHE
jgi:hypothetical protein